MHLWDDLRFGLRMMAKNPGVAAVSVVTLALGIGVNATLLTLTNAVLFKAFPFDQGDQIVYLGTRNTNRTERFGAISYPDFRDWRERAKSFDGMAAMTGLRVNLSDRTGLPESYQGTRISSNGFPL